MGIQGVNGPSMISGAYGKTGVKRVQQTEEVKQGKDVVSVSDVGKDFGTIMKALGSTPDTDDEKVKELSEKINSGNYKVSGKEVIDKVVQSLINKRI